VQLAKANREVALLTSDDLEENKKGVADTVASYIDANLDEIIESADIVAFVKEFLEMRDYVLLEEGLDIWKLLRRAKHNSNTKGIAKIRMLIENYSIGEMLTELLTSKDYMKVLGGIIQTC
jgi:NurA-like 5'-3' nuclease